MVKVGLLTVAATPRPRPTPCVNAVLPAPSSPYNSTTSPDASNPPRIAPRRRVCSTLSLGTSRLTVSALDRASSSRALYTGSPMRKRGGQRRRTMGLTGLYRRDTARAYISAQAGAAGGAVRRVPAHRLAAGRAGSSRAAAARAGDADGDAPRRVRLGANGLNIGLAASHLILQRA